MPLSSSQFTLQACSHLNSSQLFVYVLLVDDQVYMEKEVERNEYVLADFGYIWVGSARSNGGIPWTFGQVNNTFVPL